MITLKDTSNIQKEIHDVTDSLAKLRDSSIDAELESIFIDMEKLLNVLKSNRT